MSRYAVYLTLQLAKHFTTGLVLGHGQLDIKLNINTLKAWPKILEAYRHQTLKCYYEATNYSPDIEIGPGITTIDPV